MALHIQMSDEALEKLKKAAFMSRLVSFAVCAGFLLGFGGILYFTVLVIQGEIPAEFIAYTAPADDGAPTDNPTVKELSAKVSTTTPTVAPSVVVAQNAVGAVAAPVSLDTAGEFEFAEADLSLDVEVDLGEGLGNSEGGLGSSKPGGSSLEGSFYDLKLTRSGAPSRIPMKDVPKDPKTGKVLLDQNGKPFTQGHPRLRVANGPTGVAYVGEIHKFMESKWNAASLSSYYKAKTPLYTSSFYIPNARSDFAPFAFQCENVSQSGGWLAVYRGKVKAPKTGKFRFVGVGDMFIAVRFAKEMVFESGYQWPSLWEEKNSKAYGLLFMDATEKIKFWKDIKAGKIKGHEGYTNIKNYPEAKKYDDALEGIVAGKVFQVEEGKSYDIEVALGDIDGAMYAVLLMEDMSAPVDVKKGGVYDLFRTNFKLPDEKKLVNDLQPKDEKGKTIKDFRDGSPNLLPYNKDSLIWTASKM